MKCPFCGKDDDKVLDTRTRDEGSAIRRRRYCNFCDRRFTTIEDIEHKVISIVKSDGRREPFDANKLQRSVEIACIKRPVSTEQLHQLVDTVKRDIESELVYEIPSRRIGEMVICLLRELDEVAYVRFASVYRNFKDKEEFMKELNRMETPEKTADDEENS
jgi:transcriptional repressor NrdR